VAEVLCELEQPTVHEVEGRTYHPERLMQAEHVADMILAAPALPRAAEVTDLRLRSSRKLS
jgi:hypothetical protein